jgi:hypothetical protein
MPLFHFTLLEELKIYVDAYIFVVSEKRDSPTPRTATEKALHKKIFAHPWRYRVCDIMRLEVNMSSCLMFASDKLILYNARKKGYCQ